MIDKRLIIPLGIIIAIITFALWQTFPEYIDIKLVMTWWIVEVPIAVLLHYFLKEREKTNKPHLIIKESLADKQKDRDKYHNHVQKDIFENIGNNESTYYEAIRNTTKMKSLILQHFFTHERNRNTAIYTRYKEAKTVENRFNNIHHEINTVISTLIMETTSITSKTGKMIILDFKNILTVLGFPEQKNIMLDKTFSIDTVKLIDKSKLSERFFHLEEKSKDCFYVKYNDLKLSETESKKITKKCLEIILAKGLEIIKIIQELNILKQKNEQLTKKVIDTIFQEMKELNESGNPDLGVCYSCIEYFPFPTKNKHRKNLNIFNDVLLWGAEDHWE
ncbi:hypothetical protein [Nitrosopumilus ureiphilus]|uniref:Uncharacterized protein n=1 Tax=Nitrosopumilus ureiphilus TaxID=1470067 RepID=A0A7D5M3Z3_9ARCH|nr:hypothetical protein [Nitrosopumilus ureiphilus]QLH06586.1 hypothetical protein C5F50_05515 [Nitrosopumilus ureiphilus]